MWTRSAILAVACFLPAADAAQGQSAPVPRATRELLELCRNRFSHEIAEEGIGRLEPRVAAAVQRFGDDAVVAVRQAGPKIGLALIERHGPPAARILERFGDDGARLLATEGETAVRLYAAHGEDAIRVMLQHRGIGGTVVSAFGREGIRAARSLSPDGAVHLVTLAPQIRASSRAGEILGVIERYGDRACAFLWRNKGVVFSTALLAAFLSDPEPYLIGTRQLVIDPAAEVGLEAARRTDWTLVFSGVAVLGVMIWGLRRVLAPRAA